MPNHIINKVTLKGGNFKEVLDFIKIDDTDKKCNTIDFDKIIPMPKSLEIESGSNSDLALKYVLSLMEKENPERAKNILDLWNKDKFYPITEIVFTESQISRIDEKRDEMLSLGNTMINNLINYGYVDWYGWRNKYWNTKWGAYDFKEGEENQIIFCTAWSAPIPIYTTLCKMFPNITFDIEYADENIGYNSAHIVLKDEEVLTYIEYNDADADAIVFAENLWGY